MYPRGSCLLQEINIPFFYPPSGPLALFDYE
jgi:hypothetical protein